MLVSAAGVIGSSTAATSIQGGNASPCVISSLLAERQFYPIMHGSDSRGSCLGLVCRYNEYCYTSDNTNETLISGTGFAPLVHRKVLAMRFNKLTLPSLICAVVGLLLVLSCGHNDKPNQPVVGPTPTLAIFSPSTGTVGTEFSVTGTNFRNGARVWFSTIEVDSVILLGSTDLRGYVPAGVDTNTVYDVTVRNGDGTWATFDSAFTPVTPVLRYVNSATKPSGITGSTVIIEGDAFGDIRGEGNVYFSNGVGGTIAAAVENEDDWTNTFIVTTVPNGAASGDLMVQTATGQSRSLTFKITQNATFSPSAIGWTETTALPNAVSGHSALYIPTEEDGVSSNFVCVTGGIDDQDSILDDVIVSTIQPDGQLSTWSTVSPLPQPRAFHAAVVATPMNSKVSGSGFIYVLGGVGEVGADPVTTVYRGELDQSGYAGSWVSVQSLPVPLQSCRAVIFRSTIYVAGGSTNGNVPVSSVYKADIDSLGLLEEWQIATALPYAISYHGFTTFGGYLHLFGGDAGTVDPNDANYSNNETKLAEIFYMKIDLRTGNLATAAWSTNSSAMVKAVSKHTVVVAGGYAFATGGLYSGAGSGSSENKYAQFYSDGSLSSFHGATGSNTIESLGGGNLFNHAAISYVDAEGVAHVMILGGDDVNSPGSRHAGVWFY